MNIESGTISHDTLRNEDLIPAFFDALEFHAPKKAQEIKSDDDYYYILEFGNYDTETAYYLLDDLFDALNDIAPDNLYFDAHIGDGSDFGFWPVEFLD